MDEENNISNGIDTSLWTKSFDSPINPEPYSTNLTTRQTQLPTVGQISPQTELLVGNIRLQESNRYNNIFQGGSIANKMFPKQKENIFHEVSLYDTHEQLNSGDWIPKYETYKPGVDNDARLSAQQTGWDKFINPVARFASNTAKGVYLDIPAMVYSIGAAAATGRMDALWDNDFTNYVDDATSRTNFNYKNYYTQAEQEQGIGFNMRSFDTVLGGVEFTTRMIAGEAAMAVATGGASLPAGMALRAAKGTGKIAQIMNKGKSVAKAINVAQGPELAAALKAENLLKPAAGNIDAAARAGRIGDGLVKARFAVTSPLYEAGFEERHFKKEAEDQFWNYFRERGEEPSTEDINAFSSKLNEAAGGVFYTNMAILAPSNLFMIGNFMKLGNKLSKAATSKNAKLSEGLFGMGVKQNADKTFTTIKPTFGQKAAAYITPITKSALVEGMGEEGSQGIASSTFSNYVSSSYNPEYTKNTASYVDAFGKAFKDQFGTKEGREEMIVGAIIGGLFGGMGSVVGPRSVRSQYKQQENIAEVYNKGQEYIEKNFKGNDYSNEWILSLFSQGNRFQQLQEQIQKAEVDGNKIKESELQALSFVSMLDMYHGVGKQDVFLESMSSAITGLDSQMIADSTGLDISEVQDYKAEQIQNIRQMSDTYGRALEAGRYIFGGNISGEVKVGDKTETMNSEVLANALAFSSVMSNFNEKLALQSFDAIQTKIAEAVTDRSLVERLGAIGALRNASQVELLRYDNLQQTENTLKEKLTELTDKVVSLQSNPEAAQERVALAEELSQVQAQLQEVSASKDNIWKTIVDNFYAKMGKTGYASQVDLNKFGEEVAAMNEAIDNLGLSPQDKLIVENLFKQFEYANNSYKEYLDISESIQNQEFKPKVYKGMFGALRAKKDKSINEHTLETLGKIYGVTPQRARARQALDITTRDITEDQLEDDYAATEDDIRHIGRKVFRGSKLSENEQKFYEINKTVIDEAVEAAKRNPLTSNIYQAQVDNLSVKKVVLLRKLDALNTGNYPENIQKQIDKINEDITLLKQEIQDSENAVDDVELELLEELETINSEIATIESEIQAMENSSQKVQERTRRMVNASKTDYQQYEYQTPTGKIIVGTLEINNGVLQIVNENEIFDIQETTTPLINLNTSKIEGLSEIKEEDVVIEGKEIYVNGKIYKLGLKNPTLEKSISQDKEGNYEVTLQAGNGRMVKLKGSVADAIVYQHLLNKLEENATEQQIKQLREQAERDARVEKKYEELISKTKNRTSTEQKITNKRVEKLNESLERDNQILDLEDRRLEIVEAEKIAVQKEVAQVEGAITETQVKQWLDTEIKNLKEDLITNPPTVIDSRIKRYDLLQRELQSLNTVRELFDPNGTPFEQLEWLVNNIKDPNYESVEAIAGMQAPSQEDVDEYMDLLNTNNRNTTQRARMSELRNKLLPYMLLENLPLDGMNIIEIIDLYNQSKKAREVVATQTQVTPEEEFNTLTREAAKVEATPEFRSDSVGLVYDGAYIDKKKDGFGIYHIKLSTMLEKAVEQGHTPVITIYSGERNNRKVEETIEINASNMMEMGEKYDGMDNVQVNLSPENYLVKYKESPSFYVNGDLTVFLDMMGWRAYFIQGQGTNYMSLYETRLDGTLVPKNAEFTITNKGVRLFFDKETLNGLKEGDTVTLEYDKTDDFNKGMKKSTAEKQGRIYVKKDGKLVQILKGTTESTSTDKSELFNLRKQVVEAANKGKTVSVKIKGSYVGLPLIKLNQSGSAIEMDVDETNVATYGYVDETGKVILHDDVELDNEQYITPLTKRGTTSPIMVISTNGKNIAFPVNLSAEGVNHNQRVDDVLNNVDISQERKMFEINAILEENNLLTTDNMLTHSNYDMNKVRSALSSVTPTIDVKNKDEFNTAVKTSFVDTNNPFTSSKLIFDFNDVTESEIEVVATKARAAVKTTMVTKGKKGAKVTKQRTC